MLEKLYRQIEAAIRQAVRARYGTLPARSTIERPPSVALGDLALPLAFELARQLKRPPRQIATELAETLPPLEGITEVSVAGGGYLNLRLQRGPFLLASYHEAHQPVAPPPPDAPKVIVEHTNINPNKAAHIGHVRNAVLGDSFVRLLAASGHRVEVQNYIDNTGVQVADIVVGFEHLERKSLAEVTNLIQTQPRFDYYCWDLYTRVMQLYEQDPSRLTLREQMLKQIEHGTSESATIAETVATAIVTAHLKTMWRLGVRYDVLPRESEILRLKFWDAAFEQLKQHQAIRFVKSGPQKGCWVMPLSTTGPGGREESAEIEEAKIIVRSNGTVTYVGKDIAYQLWKLGLLGRDFGYRAFHRYPDGHTAWMTTSNGEPGAPRFGRGARVYNVIDARQAYLQEIVARGVEALGYAEPAQNSIHFSYEIVGLSPRSCGELGMELPAAEAGRPFVEVSGRRGLGMKADDLLDALEERALAEVRARHAELDEAEVQALAHTIAVAALRFFLLKFSRSVVIVFDFKDALNFEGETGPYVQYAVVRARNIFRKLKAQEPTYPLDALEQQLSAAGAARFLAAPGGDEFWELVLEAAELSLLVQAAVEQQEPALVAKKTFQLAQRFNLFYHKHHILTERERERQAFLLLLVDYAQRQLTRGLELLGIEVPERM
ncbi:MAG: arginine--tRNA ligase [Terriglobia bacterium]